MAIRRPPPDNNHNKRLDAVRIDRQDLKDIYDILDALPDRPHAFKSIRLKVNGYEADTLDDIFTFDRTVENVTLSSRDLSVVASLHSETGCFLMWEENPQGHKAIAEIESILEPRFLTGQVRKFALKFFVMTLVIVMSISLTLFQVLTRNDVSDERALAITVGIQFALLLPVGFLWGTGILTRSKAKPVSLFMGDHTDEPWWKAHGNELMLIFTAIAAVAGVLALVVKP